MKRLPRWQTGSSGSRMERSWRGGDRMKVKNKAVIKKLSHRVLAAKKKKNIISVLAIVLTTVLFTAVFSIGGSMIKSTRESTMIQVGSSAHAGMERLTKEQFDIVSKDPKIQGVSYNCELP